MRAMLLMSSNRCINDSVFHVWDYSLEQVDVWIEPAPDTFKNDDCDNELQQQETIMQTVQNRQTW